VDNTWTASVEVAQDKVVSAAMYCCPILRLRRRRRVDARDAVVLSSPTRSWVLRWVMQEATKASLGQDQLAQRRLTQAVDLFVVHDLDLHCAAKEVGARHPPLARHG